MKPVLASPLLVVTLSVSLPAVAAGPPEPDVRGAFKMILTQADTNKDGKLSAAECLSIWKDKTLAQKNCSFWDVDKDGFITEAEYAKQATGLGKKR